MKEMGLKLGMGDGRQRLEKVGVEAGGAKNGWMQNNSVLN